MNKPVTSKSVVINASNLHAGGGVQVATSFLQEAASLPPSGLRLSVLASSEVAAALTRLGVDCSSFASFEILDTYGIRRGLSALRRRLRGADAVFTIFGPLYVLPKPGLSVVGFAQAWIIYPCNEVYGKLPFVARLRTKLQFFFKKHAFRLGGDFIFVEADHVRRGLIAERIFDDDRITVVPSCIHDLYLRPDTWSKVNIPVGKALFKLGIVSRDYLHKNLDMIPDVKAILLEQYGLDVDFIVTFDETEWARKSPTFRAAVLNAGSLHLEQCPLFYSQLDGVFFPSLLECYSVTPLEAMVMRKPLFASDRAFVRDFCGEFPWYFDPNSSTDAARVIAQFIRAGGDPDRIEAAHRHVISLPNARDRAQSYLNTISGLLTGSEKQRE